MMDDLDTKKISLNFKENIIPMLDENKFSYLIRLLQEVIKQSEIDDETCIDLVNGFKKKDLIKLDEVVLHDFIAGVFLYLIKNTDNLNREKDVKEFICYAQNFDVKRYTRVDIIEEYEETLISPNTKIRPLKILYKKGECYIDIVKIDLFDIQNKNGNMEKYIIVIPVNTSFETKFECERNGVKIPLVSENTIHGQWIKYMNDRGIGYTKLDGLIEREIRNNNIRKCGVNISLVGKKDVYPISSAIMLSLDNIKFMLVAISEFDKKNKAKSEISYIQSSIESILNLYDVEGQGFDLYIPLIGAGRSRTGMIPKESYRLLVRTMMQKKNEIYGQIHIVINPSQIDEVDWEVDEYDIL